MLYAYASADDAARAAREIPRLMADAWPEEEGGSEAFLARMHRYIDPERNERQVWTELTTQP